MKTLSVVIITKNEEKNLPRCIESVKWADEIIVIDSQSTDRTVEVARQYSCVVHEQKWLGYGRQKIFAIDQATKDWVLNIDADEVVSPELAETIQNILRSEDENTCGYIIYRRTDFLGRWMDRCWGNEYKLRLFKRGTGNFDEEIVHEALHIEGEIHRIQAPLYHYPYPHLKRYFAKFHEYAYLFSCQNIDRKTADLRKIIFGPFITFFRMYILKKGFLDGAKGLLLCILSSAHVSYKYYLLRKEQKNS